MLLLLPWCSTRLFLCQSPSELNLEAPIVVNFWENHAHHQLTCRRSCGGVSGDFNPPFSCPLLLSPLTTVFATSISSCSERQAKKWFTIKIFARLQGLQRHESNWHLYIPGNTGHSARRKLQRSPKVLFLNLNETNLPLSLLTNVCLMSSYKLPAPP